MAEKPKESKKKKEETKDVLDPEEITLRKRLPRRLPKRKNDVYVDRKTDFKAQLGRCQKILDSGVQDVYIHGLGAAVTRAVTLALRLKAKGAGTLEVAASTSTVELLDDIEMNDESMEPETRTRNNSAIHIRVYHTEKPVPLEANNSSQTAMS